MIKRLLFLIVLLLTACNGQGDSRSATTAIPTEEPLVAPDFTLRGVDGETYTLSELQGRWVLLNFWATWCKPCVAEMPVLQEMARTRSEKLVVLGINVREDQQLVTDFLLEHDIRYPVVLAPLTPAGDQVLADYEAVSLPQTVIVNPKGEIVWRTYGELEMERFNETLKNFMDG